MATQIPPDLIPSIHNALACRYVSAAGFAILFYDHLLTIVDEAECIWKARGSIEKHVYLLNRYLTLCFIIVIIHEMCGFNGVSYTDRQCRIFLLLTFVAGLISSILSNMLILRRVLNLWAGNKAMRIFLASMHVAASMLSVSLATPTLVQAWPSLRWAPYPVNMCVATVPSLYTAWWGAPMVFELTMVISVVYHTMATPRSPSFPFARALQNNGMLFFLSVTCLRLANVIISRIRGGTLALLWIYFTWVSIATLLSRSVLWLCKEERKSHLASELFYMDIYHDAPFSSCSESPVELLEQRID